MRSEKEELDPLCAPSVYAVGGTLCPRPCVALERSFCSLELALLQLRLVSPLPSPFSALRTTPFLKSTSAQGVAVGNLGTLAMRQGDRKTAQACLEQHLQLVQQLGDWQGEINAWSKIAQLAAEGGETSDTGGETEKGGGGTGGDARVVRDGVHRGGDATRSMRGERDGGWGGSAGVVRQDAVARALWCFQKAAALAKAHDKASAKLQRHQILLYVSNEKTRQVNGWCKLSV